MDGNEKEWVVISENEKYEVSRDGQVRRIDSGRIRKWSRAGAGYCAVTLGHSQQRYIHRLVADAFCGGLKPGLEVNHIDGDKTNNVWTNLEIVTHQANQQHAARVLRRICPPRNDVRGTKNPCAKLDDEKVREIRLALLSGLESQSQIGARYGVEQTVISGISRRKTWKHVSD